MYHMWYVSTTFLQSQFLTGDEGMLLHVAIESMEALLSKMVLKNPQLELLIAVSSIATEETEEFF